MLWCFLMDVTVLSEDVVGLSEELVMSSWVVARRALADRPLRLRLLVPPWPCLGVGVLRALRIGALDGEHDGAWELVAGYDGYERLT